MSFERRIPAVAQIFLTILVTLAVVAGGAAEQSRGRASGPLVTVEFRAVTDAGSPVVDLKAADVTMKVDGRERAILAFDRISLGNKTAAPERAAIPAPFATNVLHVSEQRDTVLVIDDESIAPGDENRLELAVGQYMAGLGAADRVGVVTVQDRGLNVSLTNDRTKIRLAVVAMVGRARSVETTDDAACRTRRVLDALTSIAGNFPQGGTPVTVLFLSTGITPPGTATMSRMDRSGTAPVTVCEVQPRDYQQFERASLTSSANLYVVATSLPNSTAQRSGLEDLAGLSGNAMVELVKGGDGDMVRVVRENTAWYRASFDPDMAERNGSIHRVELQVKRSGVDLRARPQLLIPRADAKAGQSMSAKDMLKDAKAHRDFEFRAAAFASREPDSDKVKLVVLFEPANPSVGVSSAVVGLYDAKGKLTVQGTGEAANLARTPSTIAILANPGVYRMRVAAINAEGRGGTVDADVDVSLTRAGTIQWGTLLLGVADAGSFAGRLTFGPEAVAIAYLEVYGTGGSVSAQLEIAETESGKALAEGTTKIIGDGADGRRVILGGVPIVHLLPGDFVVRMVVSVDGKPVGKAMHTLRKRPSTP